MSFGKRSRVSKHKTRLGSKPMKRAPKRRNVPCPLATRFVNWIREALFLCEVTIALKRIKNRTAFVNSMIP
jgi:hypothetical protein